MRTNKKYYSLAFGLAVFTIVYNLVEGLISTYLGFEDESLALFGFGSDSFIEVISGFGIAHMIIRIQGHPESKRDNYERTALRITGLAFYLLTFALVFTSIYNIWMQHRPITTFWGIVISCISLLVMWVLYDQKKKVGHSLHSAAILADAACTLTCIYMSMILLTSSVIYHLFTIPYIDSIGSLALAYFSFTEGRECFEKARNEHTVC